MTYAEEPFQEALENFEAEQTRNGPVFYDTKNVTYEENQVETVEVEDAEVDELLRALADFDD